MQLGAGAQVQKGTNPQEAGDNSRFEICPSNVFQSHWLFDENDKRSICQRGWTLKARLNSCFEHDETLKLGNDSCFLHSINKCPSDKLHKQNLCRNHISSSEARLRHLWAVHAGPREPPSVSPSHSGRPAASRCTVLKPNGEETGASPDRIQLSSRASSSNESITSATWTSSSKKSIPQCKMETIRRCLGRCPRY